MEQTEPHSIRECAHDLSKCQEDKELLRRARRGLGPQKRQVEGAKQVLPSLC